MRRDRHRNTASTLVDCRTKELRIVEGKHQSGESISAVARRQGVAAILL